MKSNLDFKQLVEFKQSRGFGFDPQQCCEAWGFRAIGNVASHRTEMKLLTEQNVYLAH